MHLKYVCIYFVVKVCKLIKMKPCVFFKFQTLLLASRTQKSFIGGKAWFSRRHKAQHVAIIGSGPAGFVVAQTLLKNHQSVIVDVYEKLPVPFGLIRYGVSPDHQDVKNAINGYTKTANSDRFSFFGNVEVGKDISLTQLFSAYHAVVLCYGAQEELKLNIPGNNAANYFTSNQFVGWYNGHPCQKNIQLNLSGKRAIIIGVGNVALDCARMLLKPLDQLKATDISSEAYNKLQYSNINEVYLVARRGPMQMACTRKELSEIVEIPGIYTRIDMEQFNKSVKNAIKVRDLQKRKQVRLISYLLKVANSNLKTLESSDKLNIKFLHAPVEILKSNGKVSGVRLKKYEMKGDDAFNPIISETSIEEDLPCDILISCIGYGNKPIETLIPFCKGRIIQENGRILNIKGLYACGWCCHGAQGVLADSSNDSIQTGILLLKDLDSLAKSRRAGSIEIIQQLVANGIPVTSWDHWEKINQQEKHDGKILGKIREKIIDVNDMLNI